MCSCNCNKTLCQTKRTLSIRHRGKEKEEEFNSIRPQSKLLSVFVFFCFDSVCGVDHCIDISSCPKITAAVWKTNRQHRYKSSSALTKGRRPQKTNAKINAINSKWSKRIFGHKQSHTQRLTSSAQHSIFGEKVQHLFWFGLDWTLVKAILFIFFAIIFFFYSVLFWPFFFFFGYVLLGFSSAMNLVSLHASMMPNMTAFHILAGFVFFCFFFLLCTSSLLIGACHDHFEKHLIRFSHCCLDASKMNPTSRMAQTRHVA